MQITSEKIIHTDVLIIGGGTAGCYAALTLRSLSDASVVIAEKADIRRSGCLAAGVNALNAYITKGHTPQFYVTTPRKTQPASSGKTCSSPCPKASTKSPRSLKNWAWSF